MWQDHAHERIAVLEAQLSAAQQAHATTPEAVLSQRLEDALATLSQANQVRPWQSVSTSSPSIVCNLDLWPRMGAALAVRKDTTCHC